MDVNDLLSRLEGVKGRNGSWVARCPAHDDRSPSLAVKELDGRILLHCFAGCGTDEILDTLGLVMGDLFEKPLGHHFAPTRGFTAADALRCLAREGAVVAIAAADQAEGKNPSAEDAERVAIALGRINEALEFACGR